MTDRDCIKKIRKCIEDRNMSFIIGAGFSKNISDKFPLWDELLCSMNYISYGPLLLFPIFGFAFRIHFGYHRT